jgi:hypothetical protein
MEEPTEKPTPEVELTREQVEQTPQVAHTMVYSQQIFWKYRLHGARCSCGWFTEDTHQRFVNADAKRHLRKAGKEGKAAKPTGVAKFL